MRIIPVLDLMNGGVVRAIAGRRDEYRPLSTPLAASNAPEEVAAGLLRLHPFQTIYLADLDAILGRGDNLRVAHALCEKFPRTEIWLDAGLRGPQPAPWVAVIGSETLDACASPPDLSRDDRAVLSLDFRGDVFLGPRAMLASPHLWPSRVIAMTLARIGGGEGPDFERLAEIRGRAPCAELFAAGGVRDAHDLAVLARMGAGGALVASALHDGRLDARALNVELATR